jgi:lactoylglutathione lyase
MPSIQYEPHSKNRRYKSMKQNIENITIGIAVKDVEQATRWYKNLLGNVETMEPAPGVMELQLTENTWLQLDNTGDLKVGGSIIRLETKDIDSIHTIVKKLMPDVGDIELVEGVIRYFDFKDLAGNRLSYYQLI